MISNYEMVYKYLSDLASENNNGELEFPEDKRVNYYVEGDGKSVIDTIVFDIGYYNGKYIQDLEGIKFFYALNYLEIYPEHNGDIVDNDEVLHIKAKVIEF